MDVIDDRVRRVARHIIEQCGAVREGENVYIEGRARLGGRTSSCSPSSASVWARRPLVVARSDEHSHRRLLELPEAQLERPSRWIEAARAADIVFIVRMEDGDPELFTDVAPPTRTAAATRGRKPVTDIFFSDGRALDRHRLPDAAAGGRVRSRLRQPSATCSGAPCDVDYARASAPRRRRRRGARGRRRRAHHVAQGHGRDAAASPAARSTRTSAWSARETPL